MWDPKRCRAPASGAAALLAWGQKAAIIECVECLVDGGQAHAHGGCNLLFGHGVGRIEQLSENG